MRVVRSGSALAAWRDRLCREGVHVGFVPTMGALHAGHRSLIRTARLTSDAVVVSVFVNPAQFAPSEDFARYPRPFEQDVELCRAEGVDIVFAPPRAAMYPSGFVTSVDVGNVTRRWEGSHRPGHFSGVATVLCKLINLVRPDKTFVGQKDYQQAVVVKRVVRDLNLGTAVVLCRTIREADGLALSSRNAYLGPRARRAAPMLIHALRAGGDAIRRGERSTARIERAMHAAMASEPLARVDYLAVCDPATLEPVKQVHGRVVLLGAVRIGHVRLIDNILVTARRR